MNVVGVFAQWRCDIGELVCCFYFDLIWCRREKNENNMKSEAEEKLLSLTAGHKAKV